MNMKILFIFLFVLFVFYFCDMDELISVEDLLVVIGINMDEVDVVFRLGSYLIWFNGMSVEIKKVVD